MFISFIETSPKLDVDEEEYLFEGDGDDIVHVWKLDYILDVVNTIV